MSNYVVLDLETSTYNEGNPHDSRNFIVSAHLASDQSPASCIFCDFPDFRTRIEGSIRDCKLLVGVNLKFDLSHLLYFGIRLHPGTRVWDCMLAEFILSGQTNSFASLNSLAEFYGLPLKQDVVAEYWTKGISTEHIPRDIVESYGNWDVELTKLVYEHQQKDPRMTPELHKLIILCGLDLIVLTEMECNGFKYDSVGSLAKAEELTKEIVEIEEKLNSYAPTKVNFDSGDQLSCFLYGGNYSEDVYLPVTKVYKSGPRKGEEYVRNEYQETRTHRFTGYFAPLRGTKIKKSTDDRPLYQTSDEVLQQLKVRTKVQRTILELLRRRSKIEKLVGTYLTAIPKMLETMSWGEYVHGQFNQVVARTGRLSSSKPNMQNAPPETDKYFVTRYAH